MRLIGANNSPILSGAGKLAGTRNYFFGRDRRNWHLGIPTFGTVNLSEVYPGVDMVYYGNQRSLEYDFVVKPGAKPAAIRFEFAGSTDRKLMPNGDLWMKTDSQPLLLHKPTVYQLENGKRKLIDGHYGIRSDGNVGIDVSSYDQSEPLVVDPVLEYATYLGGSGDDIESGATVDAQGNAYIVGTTSSLNFPLASTIGSATQTRQASPSSPSSILPAPGLFTPITLAEALSTMSGALQWTPAAAPMSWVRHRRPISLSLLPLSRPRT